MKIAFISGPFLADCDIPLIREMQRLGHEVHYFLQMSDFSRQATVINVNKVKPTGGLFPASDYSELLWLDKYLQLEHVHVINMSVPHDWAFSSLKATWQTYRFIQRQGFDIVHLTCPLRYGAFLLYALRNKRVLTMHDPLPHSSDMGWLNRYHRAVAFRCVSDFILLSRSLVDEFSEKCNVARSRIHLSQLGIFDMLRDVASEPMQLPDRYILFMGSINPHKGIRYLCEAFRELHTAHPELHLIIAGRGEFDFDITSYTQNLPIELINRFITDAEMKSLVEHACMVVCPYIDATQSGVIMSAFALNKPVLATRVGALEEMMEDGRHGLLVAPRSATALATGINQMLQPGVLEQMQQHIEEDFVSGERSWEKIAREHVAAYKEIVER